MAGEDEYFPIQLDSIRVDSLLNFELYMKMRNEYVLYRAADLQFSERTRQDLLSNNVHTLFLKREARRPYLRYVEKHMPDVLRDAKLPEERKAQLVYDVSTNLLTEILEDPTSSENIRRATAVASHTVSFVLSGKDAFRHLVAITSYDYYTYTHSVNVCLYTVALADALGHRSQQELNIIGVGALLHDIGKSRIDTTILNKHGPLTREEYEIMKRHPEWGVAILKETSLIPEVSYEVVKHHHEKSDGRGYPDRLKEPDIHPYARMASIADVFDALTTRRSYKGALKSYSALQLMGRMRNTFDRDYYKTFVQLMGEE